jgi:acetyl-CoA carboxylase biotin carboxyl carrier protein
LTLTAKDVAEIMQLLEESSFDSLSLEIDGVKLNLQRNSALPEQQKAGSPTPSTPDAETTRSWPMPRTKGKPPSEPGLIEVTSPLLGIFYRAPRPGEPPFVELGCKLEEDTIVGIIEVMKLMHTVRAGVKGEVVEILATNGAPIEYGEILLRVRPSTGTYA